MRVWIVAVLAVAACADPDRWFPLTAWYTERAHADGSCRDSVALDSAGVALGVRCGANEIWCGEYSRQDGVVVIEVEAGIGGEVIMIPEEGGDGWGPPRLFDQPLPLCTGG